MMEASDGPSGTSQFVTRPSLSVRALKGAEGPSGRRSLRETAMSLAGVPLTVSSTWQVIGSFGERGVRVVFIVFVMLGNSSGSFSLAGSIAILLGPPMNPNLYDDQCSTVFKVELDKPV